VRTGKQVYQVRTQDSLPESLDETPTGSLRCFSEHMYTVL
jgi:hypothetical protein